MPILLFPISSSGQTRDWLTFDSIITTIGHMHPADLAILKHVYCGVVTRATMTKT